MSDQTTSLIVGKNREVPRGTSPEASREQPAPSRDEVASGNTNAAAALESAVGTKNTPSPATGALPETPKTEYEKKVEELNNKATELKDAATAIAQQEKEIAAAKASHTESETKLETARSDLQAEGAKQSEAAKAEIEKIGGMAGKNNPVLQEALGAVPAGLTKSDAEKVVESGIKKLAPDIAKNLVDPTKKPEDMSSDEAARAGRYANDIQYTSGDMKEKIERIKEREKEIDTQTAKQKETVKGAIDALAAKLPEGDRKATTDSYTKGLEALDKPGTTEQQKTNIKNALGAEVGKEVKTLDGRTFEITGHKDGAVSLKGEDAGTGAIVEQKVPYEKFRIASLADGTPLAGIHEKTFGSNNYLPASTPAPAATPAAAPVTSKDAVPAGATQAAVPGHARPEGVPADYEFHPTSTAPEGTEPKYIDTKGRSPGYWASPTAKVDSDLPLTGKADPVSVPKPTPSAAPVSTVVPVEAPSHAPATVESRRAKAAESRREIIEEAISQAASEGKPFTPEEIAEARRTHPIVGEVASTLPSTEKAVPINPKDKTVIPAPEKAPIIPAANDSWKQWQADPVTEVTAADSAPISIPVPPPASLPRVQSNTFIPTDKNGLPVDLDTARGFVPVEATGSARPSPTEKPSNPPSIPAQTPSVPSEEPAAPIPVTTENKNESTQIDNTFGFDKVAGEKHGDFTELDKTLSDGSRVSVRSRNGVGNIYIGKDLTYGEGNTYHYAVNIKLKNDGTTPEIINAETWDPITGNERTKILEELKKVGLTLPS